MRIVLLTLVAICAGFPTIHAQAPPLERMDIVTKSTPDGPVAKVRGVNISREEFLKFYMGELTRFTRAGSAPVTMEARAGLGLSCLRILVQQELLYQEAQARSVRVSMDDAKKVWSEEREKLRERAEELKGGPVDDAELLRTAGYASEDDVLKEVRRSLMIEKMARKVLRNAKGEISEEEIQAFYEARRTGFSRPEQLHLQQIFVRAENGRSPRAMKSREDARMKIGDALDRILAGQSFDGLVRQISESPDAKNGGHLGPMAVNDFPPFMAEVGLALAPGDVSDVVESEFGFHIIKLVEHQTGAEASLDQAEGAIRRILEDQKGQEVIANFCEGLIEDPQDLQVFLEVEQNLAYLTQ